MVTRIFLWGLILTTLSCVSELDLKRDDFTEVLVVEGSITTEPGPHLIALYTSAPYGSIFDGSIGTVDRAVVSLRDSDGNNQILSFEGSGIYSTTDDFRAEVGKAYYLIIEWEDKVYNSSQQYVEPLNELDSLFKIFEEVPKLNESGLVENTTGVDIYARYTKEQGFAEYFLWDYSGTFFIQTYPELFTVATRNGLQSAPKECCSECYRTEENSDIIISTFPPSSQGSTDQRLTFLEDDGYRFADKYVAAMERRGISQDAYAYWDLVKQQLSIDGDIFDPPPATLRGNIYNINDTDEIVVGYFMASDVNIDTLTILRTELDVVQDLPVFKDDCLVLTNTTTERPLFY